MRGLSQTGTYSWHNGLHRKTNTSGPLSNPGYVVLDEVIAPVSIFGMQMATIKVS